MKPKLKITKLMAEKIIEETRIPKKEIPIQVTYTLHAFDSIDSGKSLNEAIELEERGELNKTKKGTPVEALVYLLKVKRYLFELFHWLSKNEVFKTTWKQKHDKLIELKKPLQKAKALLIPGGKPFDEFYFFAFQGLEDEVGGKEFKKEIQAIFNLNLKLKELLENFPKNRPQPREVRHKGDSTLSTKVVFLFSVYKTVFNRTPSIGDLPQGPTFRFIKATLEKIFPEVEISNDEHLKNVIAYQLRKQKSGG